MNQHRESPLPISIMIILVTLGVAAVSKMILIPGAIIIIVLLHQLLGMKIPIRPRLVPMVLMIAPYLIWWQNIETGQSLKGIRFGFLLLAAMILLTLATAHLLTRFNGGGLNKSLAYTIGALALLGCFNFDYFIPIMILSLVLVLWQMRQAMGLTWFHRQSSGIVMLRIGILIVTAGCAWVMHEIAVKKAPEVNQYLMRQVMHRQPPPSAGFSQLASLTSIPREWDRSEDNTVVIRSWSDQAPGYLRGAVYDTYISGNWTAIPDTLKLATPAGQDGTRLRFMLRVGAEPAEAEGMIYTAPIYEHVYFTPLNTNQISTYADVLKMSEAFTVSPDGRRRTSGGYAYATETHTVPPPTEKDLQIQERLRRDILLYMRENQVISPDATPEAKIRDIEAWFTNSGFEYRIGLDLDQRVDPVIDFLTRIRAGHCEYFASAATLMLRSVGIPARYVTGFICDEQGAGGQVYVARRRDAHAWVEAWLDDVGWVTVEPTPPSAFPDDPPPTDMQKASEAIGGWWQRIKGLITSGGIKALWQITWDTFVHLIKAVPLWAWVIGIIILAAISYRGHLKRKSRRQTYARGGKAIQSLRKDLKRTEKRLARHGITRSPGMTVRRYIGKIEEAELPHDLRQDTLTLLRAYEEKRFTRELTPEPNSP